MTKKKIYLVAGFLIILIIYSAKITDRNSKNSPNTASVIKSAEVVAEKSATRAPDLLAPDLFPVVRVIDGDTIVVNIKGGEERVRLIGINTPETVDPRKPVQCFGLEASAKTKELLEGKQVLLKSDSSQLDKDIYGRLLRYVYLENGSFINLILIEQGYAYEYTYHVPYGFQKEFKNAEVNARLEKRGLWADGVCNI